MKYNDIYMDVISGYCKLKIAQVENIQNHFKHKPTLSQHDKKVIQESLKCLKEALNILEPETCKTMVNQNEFLTCYVYEKGE